jgi:hypothetical protein
VFSLLVITNLAPLIRCVKRQFSLRELFLNNQRAKFQKKESPRLAGFFDGLRDQL